jgi:hypothetical protein
MYAADSNPSLAGLTHGTPPCWLNYLAGPRRYLAVLPSKVRANLFAGD